MDSLNLVCLTGLLERDPVTKFDDNGMQVTTFTLRCEEAGRDGGTIKLYCPVECYGRTAERAADVSAGDVIGVEGKLKWKSYVDKHGEKKGTLAILARQVSLLVSVAVAAE